MIAELKARTYLWPLIGALLTAVAALAYPWFPSRSFTLWPTSNQGSDLLFADGERGGQSHVSWTETPGQFQCQMVLTDVWPMCGMHIPLGDGKQQGVDLSPYTHVDIDLDYQGPTQKIRLYVRNFEQGFSDPENYETNKFNHLELNTDLHSTPWHVPLTMFSVADWWKNDNNVPLAHIAPSLNRAIMFGLELTSPIKEGTHTFTVKSIRFQGPLISQTLWYQIILASWIVALLIFALRKYIGMRQQLLLDKKILASMQSYSSHLADRTEKYKQLSMLDQLTNTLNRHGLYTKLEHYYPNGFATTTVALLLIDLDHFKQLNDTYGHLKGDEVLQQLCQRIQQKLRAGEIFGRWGGEEFLLACPGTDIASAEQLAEKIRHWVETMPAADPSLSITTSIGITCSLPGELFEDSLKRADTALYQAKQKGRNRCQTLTR